MGWSGLYLRRLYFTNKAVPWLERLYHFNGNGARVSAQVRHCPVCTLLNCICGDREEAVETPLYSVHIPLLRQNKFILIFLLELSFAISSLL